MDTPKVILFDADGVTLKKGTEYFSEKFAREYDAPLDEITEFFKHEFRECQTGKRDLKKELEERLPKWGWDKSVDEFLEYWFESDVHIDEKVIGKIRELRAQGVICCLATDQEKYRAQYLHDRLGNEFEHLFFSYELGHTKNEQGFFMEAAHQLDVEPKDMRYWDDDKKNIEVAKELGIDARFFKTIDDLDDEHHPPSEISIK